LAAIAAATLLDVKEAAAERISNQVAVFAALDKVTARIKSIEVPLNETIDFGALKITPRVCYSRPPTERPKTTSFVEIDETELDGSVKRLFTGWMFAESPGLNAVEHPVFDVWLTGCLKPIGGGGSVAASPDGNPALGVEPEEASPNPFPRRRIRR
jgi:hypothetical protein